MRKNLTEIVFILDRSGSMSGLEREAKELERQAELYEDCDGRFAFIAGYTDGGAPHGVMWEEVGIDPGLPFEEKVKPCHMQLLG